MPVGSASTRTGPLRMGTALGKRYVLIGPIAWGGVSTVYHAIDAIHGRLLAIKVLTTLAGDDPWIRESIRREAIITDRLRHPSVPRVYDYGDVELGDGRMVPYVAMELLSGVSLAGRVAGGSLPWREAVRIVATVADVLVVAHQRGVVHRDLNPSNIMLTATGVKIVDFGLAITVDQSPRPDGRGEASRRRGLGPTPTTADDIYALGVLLYQLLTGSSPYPGAHPGAQLAGPTRGVAPTPVLIVPGLPRQVADLCRSLMHKRPADRPAGVDVSTALWEVLKTDTRTQAEQGRTGPRHAKQPLAPI